MARPIIALAIAGIVAVTALRFVFGLVGAASFFLGLLVKLALVVGLIYLTLSVFAPDTARKMREHWTGAPRA